MNFFMIEPIRKSTLPLGRFAGVLASLLLTAGPLQAFTDGQNASYVLGEPNFTTINLTLTPAQNTQINTYGVAYDRNGQRLFVADSQNNRVLVYNLSGGIVNGMNASQVLGQYNFVSRVINGGSINPTQSGMRSPTGVTYDASNPGSQRLFVADYLNNRVLVYNLPSGVITDGMPASNVLGQAAFTSGVANFGRGVFRPGNNGFQAPNYVSYDPTNKRLFVSDTTNHRVLAFDIPGGVINGMPASNVLGPRGSLAPEEAPIPLRRRA